MKISVQTAFEPGQILAKRGLGSSNAARRFLASEVVRFCDPYVPFQQGILKNQAFIAQDGSSVTYPAPYAQYQYRGEVMGPNIPITEGGQVAGYFSKAPKHSTGRKLQYHGAPMRGPQWDRRMLADRGGDLEKSMDAFLAGRAK